jgi:hypothetical protein
MPGSRPSVLAAWTTFGRAPARGNWGSAMKVLAAVITAAVLGAIVVNRDDIMRYVKMRQM